MQVIDKIPPPPRRPASSHKGTFGTVIVIGGSPTMVGAPALAATAALRAGAGLAKIAAPPQVIPFALAIEPSATGIELLSTIEQAKAVSILDIADPQQRAVLAIGPGMGTTDRSLQLPFILALFQGPRPVVLDADGLNLLAGTGVPPPNLKPQHARDPLLPIVMTPHLGEFQRLAQPLGIRDDPTDHATRPAAAAKLASFYHAVVVLKGQNTVVTDGQRQFINQTGNAALATAGTGDVLTGIIAALIAQGMTPFDASVLGIHLHGRAADRWCEDHGPSGLTARDLAARLPEAMHEQR
ncbi:MAG: NAD(P)H-hydrate dehydratase [Phycisphaeraceae bacterium]|nr:NAD(P)H-hydrate dehydratase [Phycisphaeraceae bacterium]|tara:strand:- start:412 stop:1302 length:891 start_codon:yes stop_codon:yes gene_type:complete